MELMDKYTQNSSVHMSFSLYIVSLFFWNYYQIKPYLRFPTFPISLFSMFLSYLALVLKILNLYYSDQFVKPLQKVPMPWIVLPILILNIYFRYPLFLARMSANTKSVLHLPRELLEQVRPTNKIQYNKLKPESTSGCSGKGTYCLPHCLSPGCKG